MAERYRFTLSDGRTHESDAGLAAIRRTHPQARITHRILLDEQGHFAGSEPFRGKSAEPKSEPVAEDENTAAPVVVKATENATETKAAPAKVTTKKAG